MQAQERLEIRLSEIRRQISERYPYRGQGVKLKHKGGGYYVTGFDNAVAAIMLGAAELA